MVVSRRNMGREHRINTPQLVFYIALFKGKNLTTTTPWLSIRGLIEFLSKKNKECMVWVNCPYHSSQPKWTMRKKLSLKKL